MMLQKRTKHTTRAKKNEVSEVAFLAAYQMARTVWLFMERGYSYQAAIETGLLMMKTNPGKSPEELVNLFESRRAAVRTEMQTKATQPATE
jgi:hypothetical protein